MIHFMTGAIGYPLLEILYRGRTHYSMSIAGGLAVSLISRIRRIPISRAARAMLCGSGITLIEYACGRIWNRRHQVWDYRRMPMQLHGQICLPFSAIWCLLSYGYMSVLDTWSMHTKRTGR